MDSKRRTGKAPAGAPGEISEREYWQQEKEKAIWDLMIFFAAVVIVAIAVGTAAWFASNKEVSGNGMQVVTEVPKYVQISVGRTGDYPLNDAMDNLVLSGQLVQAPRETMETAVYDWANRVNISNYYRFGRLIPASSDSGKHILFTPDSTGTGKNIKTNARFYRADGKTDGNLKNTNDSDLLMATAHAYQNVAEKEQDNFWNGYRHSTFWSNTNDDGYYVDIPIWLRTNEEEEVSLYVEGYVTKKNGELSTGDDDPDALYKAVRVALMKEDGEGQLVSAVPADGMEQNIIPMQDADSYESDDKSILDSKNYTVTRDTRNQREDDLLFGLQLTSEMSTLQAENYVPYTHCGGQTVVTLPGVGEGETWSSATKLIIRIWLDGDDKDCWNETAGQDWSIHLRFAKTENEP